MKVLLSQAGVNALTSTNENQFIMHSDFNTFKIVLSGSLNQNVNGPTSTTLTVNHGLSHTPIVYAFLKADTNNEATAPSFMFLNTSPYDLVEFKRVASNSTQIRFEISQFITGNVAIKIRYYAFEVPL